jgi:Mn2+/Fe2+ NRAMP family transporter
MIPSKYGPQLFSLILSGLMSLLVSGISTFHAIGLVTNFSHRWSSAWLTAWLFAFPAVMLVTPLARKAVQLLTEKD